MQEASARFGLKQAMGVVALFVMLNAAISVVVSKLTGLAGLGEAPSMLLGAGVAQAAALLIIVARERRWGRWTAPRILDATVPKVAWLAWAGAILGCATVLSEVSNYLAWFWPPPAWYFNAMATLDMVQYWPLSLLVAVFIGPVAEEFIFRGIILRGLLGTRAAPRAVIWSAALFGIAHLNPWQGLGAFCLGLLVGWAYVRTRSLALCIAAHVLNNFVAMLAPLLPPWIPGATGPVDYTHVQFQPLWFTTAGAVLLVVATMVFAAKTRPAAVAD